MQSFCFGYSKPDLPWALDMSFLHLPLLLQGRLSFNSRHEPPLLTHFHPTYCAVLQQYVVERTATSVSPWAPVLVLIPVAKHIKIDHPASYSAGLTCTSSSIYLGCCAIGQTSCGGVQFLTTCFGEQGPSYDAACIADSGALK